MVSLEMDPFAIPPLDSTLQILDFKYPDPFGADNDNIHIIPWLLAESIQDVRFWIESLEPGDEMIFSNGTFIWLVAGEKTAQTIFPDRQEWWDQIGLEGANRRLRRLTVSVPEPEQPYNCPAIHTSQEQDRSETSQRSLEITELLDQKHCRDS